MSSDQVKYFLGTSSPIGFFSLFDELYNPMEDWRAYIIKGGPGTGKSKFIESIAKEAVKKNIFCEYIHCSADPKSLDAVIMPDLKICVADGTAPHIIEPKFAGAVEEIINIGECWNSDALFANADIIRALYLENSYYNQRALRFLSAAESLLKDSQKITSRYIDFEKLINYTTRFAKREFGLPKGKSEKGKKRILTAITPEGIMTYTETISYLCKNVYMIEDNIGVVSSRMLELLFEYASRSGFEAIACYSPMSVNAIDQLLIPELSLAIVKSDDHYGDKIEPVRKIHAKRFMDAEGLKSHRYRMNFNRKSGIDLQNEAVKLLATAKEVHDELEEYYKEAMDFEAVDEKLSQTLEKLDL